MTRAVVRLPKAVTDFIGIHAYLSEQASEATANQSFRLDAAPSAIRADGDS